MMKVRPIVVNEDMVVLGGNMRLKACIEAGLKEVPVDVVKWSKEKQDEFIVKDNVGFGEWDWDILANEWDTDLLQDWGIDLPVLFEEPDIESLIAESKNKPSIMKITFESPEQLQEAEIDIEELIDRKYDGAYFSVSAGEL